VAPAGPISADEVARKTFPASFRGFDPDQVRVFLGQVAAELAALQERERLLVERVAAAEAKAAEAERTAEAAVAASVPPEPGEAELMAALGREAGRVLAAAKEAGAEIRSTAEAHASRVHRDARDEAARLRAEAERVAEDRAAEADAVATALRADAEEAAAEIRSEAERQAAVTIDAAADRGREMVREAQAVRERILRDMARRRRTALQQLEQLRVGRERLLETYGVIRSIMDEATAEVAVAEVEARAAAEAAVVQLDEPEPEIEELEAEVAALREATEHGDGEGEATAPAAEEPGPLVEAEAEAPVEPEVPLPEDEPAEPPAPDADVVDLRERPPEPVATVAERRTSALRILRPAEPETAPPPAADGDDDEAPASPVEDVFARLRADREAAHAPEPGEDGASPVRHRDAELEPLERELARALKRELADEQNAVLDALRRSRKRPTLDDLLPDPGSGAARYAGVAAGPLAAAAAAGVAAVGAEGGDVPPVDDLVQELAVEVADALRTDVAAALEATGGDHAGTAERISNAYRGWKSSRAEPLARSAALAAESRGRLSTGAPLCWVPDPDATPCPDCEGNAGAGARAAGEAFPSGVASPPAHPGCRCLVAPVDR
jgi:DivIVA domain-containing protein